MVLLLYSSLLPKKQPIVNKNVTATSDLAQKEVPPMAAPEKTDLPPAQNIPNTLENKELYTLEANGFVLRFSSKGGYLVEVFDKAFNSSLPFKDVGLIKEWSEYPFKISELPRGVVFDYAGEDGFKIRKTYRIKSDNTIELTVGLYDVTNSKSTSYTIFCGYADPFEAKDPISQRYYEASLLLGDTVTRKPLTGLKKDESFSGNIRWIGFRDKYFCAILLPQLTINKADAIKVGKGTILALSLPERVLTPDKAAVEDVYKIYVGPQDENILKSFSPDTEQIINFGFFDGISKVLRFLLVICHKVTQNWGWSIILVTILVYFALFPLSVKSMLAMKKIQTLQPKIEALKTKHKDNPQKLNTEIMELYKLEKANPFAGCLPMVLQIPVFFSLYQLLMRFIKLRGASFLWIKDLSQPDKLIVFDKSLPLIGNELNLLPLLMAGAMFMQQKFSVHVASTSPEAAEQQKIMTFLMPIIFGALFYRMSSGLVLYWFVNSLLMVGFQWKISKAKA